MGNAYCVWVNLLQLTFSGPSSCWIWREKIKECTEGGNLSKTNQERALMSFRKEWTIKKAEHWIIDAFELWCWRKVLRVPWTARRSNQSILKEISPEYSVDRLMLKLKLQYFGHLMRTDSLEKMLMLGKIEGRREGDDRGWNGWMASPTQWIWVWVNSGSWWWTARPGMLQSMESPSRTWLSN